MGYRSEVGVVITPEEEKDFKECLEWIEEDKKRDGICAYLADFEHNGVNEIKLRWAWVKWYSYFDDIKAFNKWLDDLEEKGIGYHFVRIGESNDDIEERYANHPNSWINVVRTIEFD